MGIEDITRAELLAELFNRIQAMSEPEPIPEHWFTVEEYAEKQGMILYKAKMQLRAAYKAGLVGRCQRQRRMWYYEKEV